MSSLTLISILLFSFLVQLAVASVYVTYPVSDSTIKAGRDVKISWIDDGRHPSLDNQSPFDILLYAENKYYVATLAEDVDPLAKSQDVGFPDDLPYAGRDNTLRFVWRHKPRNDTYRTVYSSDFTLDVAPSPKEDAMAAFNKTSSFSKSSHFSESSSTSTDTFSTTKTAKTVSTHAYLPSPINNSSAAAGTTVYADSYSHPNAGFSLWNSVDSERLKSQVVFVLWPAIFGLSMAL